MMECIRNVHATISFVTSFCPHGTAGILRQGFSLNFVFSIFNNLSSLFIFLLKSDRNNRHFVLKLVRVYASPLRLVLYCEVLAEAEEKVTNLNIKIGYAELRISPFTRQIRKMGHIVFPINRLKSIVNLLLRYEENI